MSASGRFGSRTCFSGERAEASQALLHCEAHGVGAGSCATAYLSLLVNVGRNAGSVKPAAAAMGLRNQ